MGSKSISVSDVTDAFAKAGHALPNAAEQVASGSNRKIVATLNKVSGIESQPIQASVAKTLHLKSNEINVQSVSSSWGHDISVSAIEGLIVFLIAVSNTTSRSASSGEWPSAGSSHCCTISCWPLRRLLGDRFRGHAVTTVGQVC